MRLVSLVLDLKCQKLPHNFISHFPKVTKVKRSNYAPQFAMSKVILPHFYKSLMSRTCVVGEKSCHKSGFKPNTCLTWSNMLTLDVAKCGK
jgi:hypothetical protein